MRTLFFDVEISGHHLEYISHLVEYLVLNKTEGYFYFIVHPNFNDYAKDILKKAATHSNIHFIPINETEYANINTKSVLVNSIKTYKLLNKYANSIEPRHVFLLYLNILIFALILHKSKYKISGILFSQYTRMQRNTMNNKLRYYRKHWQTKLLSKNKSIESIFILNDEMTCKYLNKSFNTKKFIMLPDPIQEIESTNEFNIVNEYNIQKHRKIYLHFGGLAERKGSLDILDSIQFINTETQSNICFIIAGKPDKEIQEKIQEKISFYQKNSNVQIIYIDQFIENKKMRALFDQCDFVLIPYKNIESSSGILGHAAVSQRPVIGNSNGLLGELISTFKLGYTLQIISPKSIGYKINETYNQIYIINNKAYLQGRKPNDFSNIIFQNLTQ